MVRDRIRAVVRYITDADPQFRGSGNIDVIVADPVTDDGGSRLERLEYPAGYRGEVHEDDVGTGHRLGALLLGAALEIVELQAKLLGQSAFSCHVAENLVGDNKAAGHSATSWARTRRFRPPRFSIRERIPAVQSGASSAVVTSLTRAPSVGEEMLTTSPRL